MKDANVSVTFKAVEVKDANDKPIPAMKTEKDKETGQDIQVPELDKDGKPVMQKATKTPIVVPVKLFDTLEDVAAILTIEDEEQRNKQVKLLCAAMNDVVEAQIRALVKEDEKSVRENGIPSESLTWQFLANMPEKERKGAAISDEVWATFEKDYIETIVHHGVSLDQAKMAAKLFTGRFYAVKTNKKIVEALQKRLATWYGHSSIASTPDMQSVYETLQQRAETLLKADEDTLLAAI